MPPRPSATPPDPVHVRAVLERSALFGALPEAARDALAARLEWVFVPGAQALVEPGDPPRALFLVVHGRLRVQREREAAHELGEGEVAGDVAVLTDQPHDAGVTAVRDAEVGVLTAEAFWALAETHPALVRGLGRSAVARLRPKPPAAPRLVNVAIVSAEPGAPVHRFAEALAAALGALAPILWVDARRFEAEIGPGAAQDDVDAWDETDRRVVRWILDQERRHRFVLYEADPTATPWTRRCVRMADRVLVVARSEVVAEVGPAEQEIYASSSALVDKDLVLVHADGSARPQRTREWLSRRPGLTGLHHVDLSAPDTVARLARFLTGRAVGLVLGGGGARSTAQMGAWQALRDAGIPIDRVGGTSAGGGVAAMIALGWTLDEMRARNRRAFVGMAPFRTFTLPYYSMVDRRRVQDVARFLYGDARIEDLWTSLFCVSCDLVTGRMVVHRQGEVWRAVLATTALPGVVAPVWWQGQLLVDGGVFDNNPVAVMAQEPVGPVVLIDIGAPEAPLVEPTELLELPTNAAAAWHRFKWFGRRVRVPTIPEIVVRTMTIARPDEDVTKGADLYVRPPVDACGLTDFRSQEALIAIGYNATMDALEARAGDAAFLERMGLPPGSLVGLPRMPVPTSLAPRR